MVVRLILLLAFLQVAFAQLTAHAAATLLPNGEQCFQATSPTSGGSYGPLTTLGTIAGGSGYANATYTNVPLTGGSGFGATATVIVSAGAVSSVSITNPGSHYTVADTLSAIAANLGGSGSGFSVPVSAVSTTGTGLVGLLGPVTGGSGGTNGAYGGVSLTGGAGSGATANITVSGGAVTAVAILNPGTQYQVGDTLSASSGAIGGVTGFSVQISSISVNNSLAGGQVWFYIPNTTSTKQTWANSTQTVLNTNPVTLDQNGCATIYGTGTYRQVLQDSLGNTVWDKLTTDTSAQQNTFWAGLAGGTPNAITVTDPGFNGTDGSIINFIALSNNTTATTLNPSSFGNISVVKDTSSGPQNLSGGEIVSSNPISVIYSATENSFHILNPIIVNNTNQCLLITAFGGAGNNSTDNTVALVNALAAMTGNGGCIYFQPGIYKFNSQPTLNLPSGIFSLALRGSGQDNTILTWPNSTGGILINYGSTESSVHVSDLSFTTSITHGGSAITLNLNSPVSNPANTALSDIRRVAFRGADGYAMSDFWDIGVNVQNVSNVNFDGITAAGPSNSSGGTGISLVGLPGSSTYAVQFNVINSALQFLANGIAYGSFVQGVAVTQTNFTADIAGINVTAANSGTNAQLFVSGSQFNAFESGSVGINLLSPTLTEVNILGNLFTANQAATGITVGGPVSQLIISGNNFAATTTSNTAGIIFNGVTGTNGIVGDNTFNSFGNAVAVLGGFTSTGQLQLTLNKFNNNTTNYSVNSSASGVLITDRTTNNVGQLPACNVSIHYSEMFVIDANVPTYTNPVTGGGSTPTNVICDAANWTAH